jgi:uncharacterized coiled-coil protein SlyX
MAIQYRYEKQDEIPAGLEAEYVEKDGGWVIKDLVGLKPESEFNTVHGALAKERTDHRATKSRITTLESTLGEREATIAELNEAISSPDGDKKVAKLVEQRVAQQVAPIQRKLEDTTRQLGEAQTTISAFQAEGVRTTISKAISKAAGAAQLRDTAIDDAVLLGGSVFEVQEGVVMTKADIPGVTPGVTPDVWLTSIKTTKPHWFKESSGGGAGGGGAGGGGGVVNPWTKQHWNLTKQGLVMKESADKAAQMARAAGSSIGATKPPEK